MVFVYSVVTSLWKRTLAMLHLGTLLWLLYPTCLITCASLSRVRPDQRHTNAWCLHWSPSLRWWLCTSTRQSTSQAPARFVHFSLPQWVSQYMGSHVHTQQHPCMGSLQTNDELWEFFIVLDLTPYACLQLNRSWTPLQGKKYSVGRVSCMPKFEQPRYHPDFRLKFISKL